MDDILIGKFLGVEILGYYIMAFYLMDMPLAKFNDLAKPVLLSYLSKIRSHDKKLKEIFLGVSKAALWLIFPILAGIALVANEIVPVVFGDKWMPMVIPLIFLCIAGLFRAFTDHIPQLFFAMGNPQMSLKINFITAIILPMGFYIGVTNYELKGILWAWLLVYPFVCYLILGGLEKLTGITKWMYIKNLKVPFLCTIIMAMSVVCIDLLVEEYLNVYLLLVVKILIGFIVYSAFSYVFFKEEIFKGLELIKNKP